MKCNCKRRWQAAKTFVKKLFNEHTCDYQQVGIWSDKHFTCKPLMRCKICGDKKQVGKDD